MAKTKHLILKAIEESTPKSSQDKLMEIFENLVSRGSFSPAGILQEAKGISEEDKAIIEQIIKDSEEEINIKAKEILTNEIREGLSKPGKIEQLKQMVKEKRKIKLLRRKGCIYLGFENAMGEFTDIPISTT